MPRKCLEALTNVFTFIVVALACSYPQLEIFCRLFKHWCKMPQFSDNSRKKSNFQIGVLGFNLLSHKAFAFQLKRVQGVTCSMLRTRIIPCNELPHSKRKEQLINSVTARENLPSKMQLHNIMGGSISSIFNRPGLDCWFGPKNRYFEGSLEPCTIVVIKHIFFHQRKAREETLLFQWFDARYFIA